MFNKVNDYYMDLARSLLEDKYFFRYEEIEKCKNKEEEEALRLRWAIEDVGNKIADAVRSVNNYRPRLFGIF